MAEFNTYSVHVLYGLCCHFHSLFLSLIISFMLGRDYLHSDLFTFLYLGIPFSPHSLYSFLILFLDFLYFIPGILKFPLFSFI